MTRSRPRRRLGVVLLGAALLASACSTGRVYEFVDPAFDQQRYDGFMVYAAFEDLALQAAFERALCQRLHAAGHACNTMLRAAPPTREQDGASRHAATRTSGAQATLLIELVDTRSASRRAIAGGRPAYEISLIDNDDQQVAARLAVEPGKSAAASVQARARRLAERVVTALSRRGLLFERG